MMIVEMRSLITFELLLVLFYIDRQIDKLYMMCHKIRPLFLNGDSKCD